MLYSVLFGEMTYMIKMVKLVGIYVKDQDRSIDFYCRKLGFELATDVAMGEGQRWIELRIPGADTRVVLFTPPDQEDRSGTFGNVVFGTDNVEKTYQELRERGVEFAQPPKTQSWGTSAILKDPDGNSFVLSSVP
jgi:catechol 2,3-dioxygenase-like lactoylglutathione lyase family enzyme